MKKICFVLPRLTNMSSPIVGLSLLINHLANKYHVLVIGVLEDKSHNLFLFNNTNIVVLREKTLYQKMRKVKKFNPDIIISSLFQSDIFSSFFFSNVKKISMVRSDILLNYCYDQGYFKGSLMYVLHALSLSRFQKVIALSSQNASRLIFTEDNKIKIIRNFFHETNQSTSERINNDYIHLVFAGHLTKRKGILNLIKTINYVTKKNINVKLTVLGKGPLMEKIENYIISNRLQKNIILMGYVDNVLPFIKRAHYSILPSYSEGTSRFILESLHSGKKVIVRNTSGIDEVLNKENAYLFNTDDQLKKTIRTLFNSKIFKKDPCKNYPKIFDKNTNLHKIEEEIRTLINK